MSMSYKKPQKQGIELKKHFGQHFLHDTFYVDQVIAKINFTPQTHVFEIGCGEGFSTMRLRDMLPKQVDLFASEYVADLVPKARKRNPKVTITEESVYETKHKDSTFDVVFLLEVLEHLEEPEIALKELLIEGGATAWAILEHLQISKLQPLQQMSPGVIRMGIAGDNQLCVTLKPGSYEWPTQVWVP